MLPVARCGRRLWTAVAQAPFPTANLVAAAAGWSAAARGVPSALLAQSAAAARRAETVWKPPLHLVHATRPLDLAVMMLAEELFASLAVKVQPCSGAALLRRLRRASQPWPSCRAEPGRHPAVRSDGESRRRAVRAATLVHVGWLDSPAAAAARCRKAASIVPALRAALVWCMCHLESMLTLLGAPCRRGQGSRREPPYPLRLHALVVDENQHVLVGRPAHAAGRSLP